MSELDYSQVLRLRAEIRHLREALGEALDAWEGACASPDDETRIRELRTLCLPVTGPYDEGEVDRLRACVEAADALRREMLAYGCQDHVPGALGAYDAARAAVSTSPSLSDPKREE